jgi:diguanylate cyclase
VIDENLIVLSVSNLKKALPLMMRYHIPTTPLNYSLWYSYVTNDIPELNSKLDNLIAKHDVFPSVHAESLYREFVADKTEINVWEIRESIENMLMQLDQSLVETNIDTEKFQQAVGKTVVDIKQADKDNCSLEDVLAMLENLEKDSKNMHRSTQFFGESLAIAKDEIASLKVELEKSQKKSFYDSLTGLLNRHAFDAELSSFLEGNNPDLCLIMADIDHFKKFNDQWGHLLGDQVLKAVGEKLSDSMINGATAYRFGGEEFMVLLPKSNLRVACQYAEALRQLIGTLTVKDKRTAKKPKN